MLFKQASDLTDASIVQAQSPKGLVGDYGGVGVSSDDTEAVYIITLNSLLSQKARISYVPGIISSI